MCRFRTLTAVCLLWLCSGIAALADCDRLLSVVELVQHGFANGTQADKPTLIQINNLISELDNDALLAVLRQSGQGNKFGSLRHFLTVMKFITHRPETPGTLPLTFSDDLAQASGIVSKVCSDRSSLAAIGGGQQGGGQSTLGTRSGSWQQRSGWIRDINAEIERHRDQLRVLGYVVIWLVLALLLAIAGHFTVMALRILYRGRSVCDVPVTLDVMGDRFDGRITVIGKLGCQVFLSPIYDAQDLPDISRGTYLNVVIDGQTQNAKTLMESTDVYRLLFSTPLPRKKLKQILATSSGPVRYDLGLLNLKMMEGYYIGTG